MTTAPKKLYDFIREASPPPPARQIAKPVSRTSVRDCNVCRKAPAAVTQPCGHTLMCQTCFDALPSVIDSCSVCYKPLREMDTSA